MMAAPRFSSLLFLSLCVSIRGCSFAQSSAVINQDVKRTIDLTSQVAKVTLVLKIAATTPTVGYKFCLPRAQADHIASIEAMGMSGQQYKIERQESGESGQAYMVEVPLSGITKFHIQYVLSHVMKALPKEVRQLENQLVTYSDSRLFYTPYYTNTQVMLNFARLCTHLSFKCFLAFCTDTFPFAYLVWGFRN